MKIKNFSRQFHYTGLHFLNVNINRGALDYNNNWHGGSNDVTFSANDFEEITNKETKQNLLNSAVLEKPKPSPGK